MWHGICFFGFSPSNGDVFFRKENLFEAVLEYQRRERRFGKTSEQL